MLPIITPMLFFGVCNLLGGISAYLFLRAPQVPLTQVKPLCRPKGGPRGFRQGAFLCACIIGIHIIFHEFLNKGGYFNLATFQNPHSIMNGP